jgi:tRNA threonylcarbamoyladenosine biosynthesis protein TsaE
MIPGHECRHTTVRRTSANVKPVTLSTNESALTSAAVTTASAEQTRAFAASLAALAEPGDRIALLGPLGAGKTQFAKGFAAGLGVRDVVNSPSFTLMAEYAGRMPLFHQDLYRLSGAEEILGGGLLDERQEDGVTLIEWGERMPEALDSGRLTITFTVGAEDDRTITVRAADEGQERYVAAARAWSAE